MTNDKPKHYNDEEKWTIAENARKYGGSFVQALIEAYMRADRTNARKIEMAFPEYLEEYLNFGNKQKAQ
jgi:hypothetical protein